MRSHSEGYPSILKPVRALATGLLPVLLVLQTLYFIALYGIPPIRFYNHLWLQTFDYGIQFQATDLIAHGNPLFLTTRGLRLWADHQKYFIVLLSVVHIFPNPHYALLIAHSLGILGCGFFVMFYCRRDTLLALLLSLFVWASPLMLNMNIDLIHPEAFVTFFLLVLFYAARRGLPKTFYVFLLLALSCKEDVAITAGGFLLLALWKPMFFRLPSRHFIVGLGLCMAIFFMDQRIVSMAARS